MSSERIIAIAGLEVMARIGVPEEERVAAQRLLLDLRFAARDQPEHLGDDLAATIDYFSLSRRAILVAGQRPRKLIETLADELAESLMADFSLRWIEVTVRKFILKDTEHVAVTVRRSAAENP